jgi:zinc protease
MPKLMSALIALLLATATATTQNAPAAPDYGVKVHKLKNGMKILVQEDHSIPSVAMYIFYKIGSRNERPGTTGLSHFFEHMMFNGAKKYGPKMFDQTLEAAGGSNNAYTSNDVTVYQDWFPRSALETVFDLEADRIQNLAFDEKMIESERGVVASERRTSVEASNFRLLYEQMAAAAYTAHPYQWPVIGWMVDIESWTMEDLKHHFQTGYSPANSTMVVTGDVKAEDVFKLAEKHIQPIPSRGLPPPVKTVEPEQMGERRVTLRKFAQVPLLIAAWHVPESSHPDYYALQIMRTVLFEGDSSRMYQRLVDKDELATSINGSYDLAFDPTLFEVSAEPRAGVSTERVEKVIYEELDRLKTGLVSDQELEKAKNIQLAGFYRQMKTINGKAGGLGDYETFFGDYRKMFSAPDDYSKVTKDDIQRVAKKYFTENNRTVAVLIPEKQP